MHLNVFSTDLSSREMSTKFVRGALMESKMMLPKLLTMRLVVLHAAVTNLNIGFTSGDERRKGLKTQL
jgi:hypothetical protein